MPKPKPKSPDDMTVRELLKHREKLQSSFEKTQKAFAAARVAMREAKDAVCEFDSRFGRLTRALKGAKK